MKKYILTGEIKSKKNERIFNTKTHRSFPSKEYKQWHDNAFMQLKSQMRGEQFEKCKMIIRFYHKDNVRRDSDNQVSSLFDTLQDVGLIVEDRWQMIGRYLVDAQLDKEHESRCEIEIYDISEAVEITF